MTWTSGDTWLVVAALAGLSVMHGLVPLHPGAADLRAGVQPGRVTRATAYTVADNE